MGSFTYDTAEAPETVATRPNWREIPITGSATVGGKSYTFDSDSFLMFIQNAPGQSDFIQVYATTFPDNLRLALARFNLDLAQGDGLIPDLSNLPVDPLPLTQGLHFSLGFSSSAFLPPEADGVLTSVSTVPDQGNPALLLGLSLLGLACVRRRNSE